MDAFNAQIASTDYLSLLTVQLQNQDPIEPVDQESLINDLTQFSILEGIQSLNTSFEEVLKLEQVTQGLDLVGRQIDYTDPTTNEPRSGLVESVDTSGGNIQLLINQQTIGLENVASVNAF